VTSNLIINSLADGFVIRRLSAGAGVPLTSPQLFGMSHTDDIRQAILYIAEMYPRAPLLGLAFSLGASVLTRYVAEEGESCRLISACALACVCTYHFHFVFTPNARVQPWDGLKTSQACVPPTHASICNLLRYICLARTVSRVPGSPALYIPKVSLPA
jgi:hypothetical protein